MQLKLYVVGEYYLQPQTGRPTAWLIGIEGHVRGQRYPIDKAHYRIGSKTDNDLCIKGDEYVSGNHAYLRYEQGSLYLFDKGSRNGTYLNSQRVAETPHVVRLGDRIRVGESVLQIADSPGSSDSGAGSGTGKGGETSTTGDRSPTYVS